MITTNCDECGKSFTRERHNRPRKHAFCSLKCHGLWNSKNLLGNLSPHWKGNNIKNEMGYLRAKKLFKCPPGYERHHIDGNPRNNSPSNVMIVTKKEHMQIDGRIKKNLDKMIKNNRSPEGRMKRSKAMKLWWRKKKNDSN
jgi:hypothetical protein